jgi:glycosyltransferase involved in cell wall biosynthesis
LIGGLDPVHSSGLSASQWTFIEQHPDITITGFTSKVEEYLSISDYFVFPSKKEGIPVCVLEALAMGVPVIASDSRGNNEVIEHLHNGVLMPPSPDHEEEIVYHSIYRVIRKEYPTLPSLKISSFVKQK